MKGEHNTCQEPEALDLKDGWFYTWTWQIHDQCIDQNLWGADIAAEFCPLVLFFF